MNGWTLFGSVFAVIFIAELPDKTALATLVLATRHRPVPVLAGAGLALAVQSVIAVAAGHLLSLLPQRPVHISAGVVFIVSAVVMWRRKQEPDEEGMPPAGVAGLLRSMCVVFAVVFVAEWGDLTQLATAALAARYHAPLVVFAGATLALWAVAAVAVGVGSRAGKLLDPHVTQRIAAVLFALIGAALAFGVL